ncbi:MAG TPA: peptidoglycan DD-metalloendopeptidase family protein [Herpetosiphonaceae bacterium]
MRVSNRLFCFIILFSLGLGSIVPAAAAPSSAAAQLNVQKFLDGQPGALKSYREGKYTAAQVIEGYTSYYNLDPRIILTLLELGPRLLTEPTPAPETIRKPFGAAGPDGLTQQVEWAVRDIRAGFGPYTSAPVVKFSDGTSVTLDIKQEASVIAVQRFLASGRAQSEWRGLVDRYVPLYTQLWGKEPALPTPTPAASRPFLKLPWPAGVEVIHSSYFDHAYPTVDRGGDGNSFIVNYLGRGNLSYNTHDGHDYYFPAQPIGTPMLAAAPGIAYAYTTRGNGVVIRHGGAYAGYETIYWHLDQFAVIFEGKIDKGVGVAVEAGTVLGTSGKTGFTSGGAHLHFEVRHNGKQVDPYGWYGSGPDPCSAWAAGCETSVWLWDESLSGLYDFTRPDAPAPQDREPPTGNLAVVPDGDLGLLAHFDENLVPAIGQGIVEFSGTQGSSGAKPSFKEGVFDRAIELSSLGLSYPISGNLELERGTIAFWARLPAEYPQSRSKRHYLVAASANPEDGKVYTDTLALRREQTDERALWNFWTVDSGGVAHNLTVSDTLQRDAWHHFAVAWERDTGRKSLFIDGQLTAQASSIALPNSLGEQLQLGRFIAGFGASGIALDELAVFKRALNGREIKRLAEKQDLYSRSAGPISTARIVTDRTVVLDANAIDPQGGIVSVQLRRDNEPWSGPLAYHDSYRWSITGTEGTHTFAIRYRDRADNETVVTTTLELQSPISATGEVRSTFDTAAVLSLAVNGIDPEPQGTQTPQMWMSEHVEMQLSIHEDFRDAVWEPFVDVRVWNWQPGQERKVFVRFRDEQGRISKPQPVGPDVTAP